MLERVNPAMSFCLYGKALEKARDPECAHIVYTLDATDLANKHVMGVLANFVYRKIIHTDLLGNQTHTVTVERMPMMLQPVVNKITVRIRKSGSGPAEFWPAETPRAFSDAAVLSAMHPLLIDPDLVEKSTVVSDAARDNVGSARQDHPV